MLTATPSTLPADLDACCPSVTASVLDDEASKVLARVFRALGDPTRVKLVSLIAAAGDGGACVCDLVPPVHLSQPTVSHHLRQLVEAGLVSREQRGRWAYYRIVEETLRGVAEAVTPVGSASSGR